MYQSTSYLPISILNQVVSGERRQAQASSRTLHTVISYLLVVNR